MLVVIIQNEFINETLSLVNEKKMSEEVVNNDLKIVW